MPEVHYRTGVYLIRNRINGKVYVGSAARSLASRIRSHKYYLALGNHDNQHLQRAWNKFGAKSFVFVIACRCAPEECLKWEQAWISRLKAYDRRFGYNKSPTAGSPLGVRHSIQARLAMSLATRGKPKTESHRRNIAIAKSAMTNETKRKMSEYAQNRTVEHRRRISIAMVGNQRSLGRVSSEPTRQKISKKAKARWALWRTNGNAEAVGRLISLGQKRAKDGL